MPLVFEIKFALQNFRKENWAEQIESSLLKWKTVAAANNLTLVVDGIEDAKDDHFLDDLEIRHPARLLLRQTSLIWKIIALQT